MVDPLSGSVLGATLLKEGIKFLYSQAGEVLKRWRERRESPTIKHQTEPVLQPPVGLLAGPVVQNPPDYEVVAAVESELTKIRHFLSDYVDGIKKSDVHDALLQEQLDAMRLFLERVYRQQITFAGENRGESKIASSKQTVEVVGDSGNLAGIVHHDVLQPGEQLRSVQDVHTVYGSVEGITIGKRKKQ